MTTNHSTPSKDDVFGSDRFEATLTVGDFYALTDARTLFALMFNDQFVAARELFMDDDGGVNRATLEQLDELVERLRPLSEATPFTQRSREMLERIKCERGD